MDWSFLELKLISCKDLKAFNFFQKLSAYSVASIMIVNEQAKKKEDQRNHLQQRQKTSINKGGLVDRTIGEVRVPLKDLIDEFCGVVRFVSYQVRNSDGKPNGVLNFSYKLIEIERIQKSTPNVSPQIEPSTEAQFSSKKVVYPKIELDDESEEIHYPSLDDIYNSPRKNSFPSPEGYMHYGRNSAILLPMQVPCNQGWMHPNSRSSPMAQPSATYLYTVQSTCYGNGLQIYH
ncbi:hypothetical protein PTKIN_Ptkin07bG0071200 [Pterospermum kingtungense]